LIVLKPWDRRDQERPNAILAGSPVSISIKRFAASDGLIASWNSVAFADSLAAHLTSVRGLDVWVEKAATPSDFILHGEVTRRDGRLVITASLGRDVDDKSKVWTATYWRAVNPGPDLAQDIAAGVAEAVALELVRRDLATKAKR
jgi:hypothetical protein